MNSNNLNIILNQWSLSIQVSLLLVLVIFFSLLRAKTTRNFVSSWWLAWCFNATALLAVFLVLLGTEWLSNYWFRFIYLLYATSKILFALFMLAGLYQALKQRNIKWLQQMKKTGVSALLFILTMMLLGWDTLQIQILVYFTVGSIFILAALPFLFNHSNHQSLIIVLVFLLEGLLFFHHGAVLLPTQWGQSAPSYMTHISFIDAVYECILGITCLFIIAKKMQTELRERNALITSSQLALRELVNKDPLTGLWHKRYYAKFLEQHKYGAYLAHFKIDAFEAINHEWGHSMGDLCLKWTAETLIQVFDAEDGLFRIGNNAFVAIIPGVEKDKMVEKVKRVKSQLAMSSQCTPIYQLKTETFPYLELDELKQALE